MGKEKQRSRSNLLSADSKCIMGSKLHRTREVELDSTKYIVTCEICGKSRIEYYHPEKTVRGHPPKTFAGGHGRTGYTHFSKESRFKGHERASPDEISVLKEKQKYPIDYQKRVVQNVKKNRRK